MSFQPNIPSHKEGDKCPACSADKDKGGRLILRVSKFKTSNGFIQFWLACSNCKYSVSSRKTALNGMSPGKREKYAMERFGKASSQ